MVREQVVVAAAEQRRAQRADERELVGGVVDRAQDREEVADLAAAVDERARLGAVRDAGGVERVLEVAERRARRQQDADVAEPRRSPLVVVEHLPLLFDRGVHRRDDLGRFALAQRVGVGIVVVRDAARAA